MEKKCLLTDKRDVSVDQSKLTRIAILESSREERIDAVVIMDEETSSGFNGRLAFSIASCVLGASFTFGYNTGVVNTAEGVIKDFYNRTYVNRDGKAMTQSTMTLLWSFTVAAFALGGMIGGFQCWILLKGTLLRNNLLNLLGGLLMLFSDNAKSYEMLIVGRLVIGICAGIFTGAAPLYLSEIAPISLRGFAGVFNQLAITFGVMISEILGLQFILGTANYWKYAVGMTIVPMCFQLCTLIWCPESPRYLMLLKNDEESAEKALYFGKELFSHIIFFAMEDDMKFIIDITNRAKIAWSLLVKWIGALGSLVSWSSVSGSADDDWIDRVNHIWTVLLLALFAVVVTSGQYILGDAIQCWTPAEFTGQFNSYAKSICWISNTYYIPQGDVIPENIATRQEAEITYYQWVPIILLFQALMFKIPNIAWRLLNGYSGINMDKICILSESTLMSSPDDRQKNISHIAKYMHRWIESQRDFHDNALVRMRRRVSSVIIFCLGKRDGTFLTGYYIFIKFLYAANVVGQFFLLNAFMATDYNVFGFEVMSYLFTNGEWTPSPRFPRVTLCDFVIRQLSNHHRYTVQCVLPLNLFNEKIFIFLWFWLFLMAFLTFFNFASWLYYTLFKENRTRYVKKYLNLCNEISTGFDKKLARKFADDYLRNDGIFVLRVIEKNSSGMVLCDLVISLWKLFKEEYGTAKKPEVIDTEPVKNGKINNDGYISKTPYDVS
ncbi:inx [Mytilus edulis]|uniref:Innexin n=1 Tax=Mytilus edulis TaxID=6550 RepID=A0A8S3S0L2_MYTED|nr:inx [Mytilus edulis]